MSTSSDQATTTFAAAVQTVLASDPPFLAQGGQIESLALLSQLLNPKFLNGDEDNLPAWDALQKVTPSTSAPFDLLAYVATTHGETPSPDLSALLSDILRKSSSSPTQVGQILDDHSICLSCTIPTDGHTSPEVSVTPHTIELVSVGKEGETETGHWWKLPWSSGEKLRKAPPQPFIAKKIWCPPTNSISVLSAWWGYQIFIPHSLMLEFGDEVKPYVDTADKIKASLQFIQDHVPATIAAMPGVAQLRALLPIISMICSFVVWSWTSLKGDDHGDGIILAATWILPVALIPRPLDRTKFPAPSSVTPPPAVTVSPATAAKMVAALATAEQAEAEEAASPSAATIESVFVEDLEEEPKEVENAQETVAPSEVEEVFAEVPIDSEIPAPVEPAEAQTKEAGGHGLAGLFNFKKGGKVAK